MIDSKKLLNFDPDREYLFHWPRGVDFEPARRLLFDPGRELLFDADRELDIRLRGVIFRGNVCPGCGGLVLQDAIRCDACGHVFEERAEAREARARRIERKGGAGARGGAPVDGSAPGGEGREGGTFRCRICGTLLYTGTARCPICGIWHASHGRGDDSGQGEWRSHEAQEQGGGTVDVIANGAGGEGGAGEGGSGGEAGDGGGAEAWRRYLPKEDWKV